MTVLASVAWPLVAGLSLVVAVLQWRARAVGVAGMRRACHELRGPLTAARLGLQFGARTGELSPDRLRALDIELTRAGAALDDLSGPAGGRSAAGDRTELDVVQMLEETILAYHGMAEVHGAHLHLRWAGPRARVCGNRVELAQVTGNLLANAIEHGGGEVVVSGAGMGEWVRIEVLDGGPGLPAPVRELLARASRRHNLGASGAHGHGLAVIESLVKAHGGCLTDAASERGARLVVELPAAR